MTIWYNLEAAEKKDQKLVEEYWLLANDEFCFKVSDLKLKYKLNLGEILSSVSLCDSFIDFGLCCSCRNSNIEPINTRYRAKQIIENVFYHYFCAECREKARHYCEKLSDKDRKNVWMKLCYKYQLWKKLDKDETNFLKALFYLKSWHRIYREMIAPHPDYGYKILNKLDKMNLIDYHKNEVTNKITVRMLTQLEELIERKQI